MKTNFDGRSGIWRAGLCVMMFGNAVFAQTGQFTGIVRLTNREVALKFEAPAGPNYRIDTTTNLPADTNLPKWSSLLTLRSIGVNQHTDSAAPFLGSRFYRAEQLTNAGTLTGDHLVTTNGDVVMHPLYHASLVMSWNGKIIYSDPDDDPAYESRYQGMPGGDLILITHEHTDHYSTTKLTALRAAGGLIIVPQRVYNLASFSGFRGNAIPLRYGESTNVFGLNVLAVPGYNANHTYTNNNSYLLTIGGKRIFISGDTGDVPEIRTLSGIDVAFLCMNVPFTMTVSEATNCVSAFKPAVVYPYHYRDSSNATTNAAFFKQQLSVNLGIEVRLRSWY